MKMYRVVFQRKVNSNIASVIGYQYFKSKLTAEMVAKDFSKGNQTADIQVRNIPTEKKVKENDTKDTNKH